MFDDFTAMAAEARYEAVKESKGKGIKILTPKQMLQRLQIAHLHMEKHEIQHISYSKKKQTNCLFILSNKKIS